ncbi:hypothetical protein SAMN05518672_101995 [Chitinophaga sp. CF118]|uniref:hypothetical protein n=1 Tax=Chitinophaga sp. CF118 TaxID=1884367 RepID=UPI0008E60633|nr:hypothetical protein [Chitinophaga sp. CF118]SFD19720.1 hypothetical protein SAMN05518672_101995 [Chitinophaga sp. CF118]
MRTGNKLLLSFVALIVLLMLLSDIVLWANFKRGKSGDGELYEKLQSDLHHTIALQPARVLQMKSDGNYDVEIKKSDKYALSYSGDSTLQLMYSQHGDTLFLEPYKDRSVILYCPDIQTILLSNANVIMSDMKLARLNIISADSCHTTLEGTSIGSFHFTGGTENYLRINGGAAIDSLHLKLGKYSSFISDDIPYKYTSMKIDSIKVFEIRGRSLEALKEIK